MFTWPRARRLGMAAGVILCLATGVADGQISKPPPGSQQGTPGGVLTVSLPDLVILKFHFAKVECKLPGDGKPGYRGWFELKNQGLGAAVPPKDTDRMLNVYFGGKVISWDPFHNTVPIASGHVWGSDHYIPQPAGAPPYTMVARVDPDQVILEMQESNNDFPFQITQDARHNCRAQQQVPGGPKVPAPKP